MRSGIYQLIDILYWQLQDDNLSQDFSHELWETLLDFQMSIEEVHPSIKRGEVHVCKKAPASVESDVWGGWQYQESRLLFKTKMVGCHFGSQN